MSRETNPGRRCRHCGKPLDPGSRVDARWCDVVCRGRGRRRVEQGLPAAALAEGGRRGRVPMGVPTRRDRLVAEIREQVELENVVEHLRRAAARGVLPRRGA